jgi:hypothetical protein
VEVDIRPCSLADDAAGAFVECLQSDRGSIFLYRCRINNQILVDALPGSNRVTSLQLPLETGAGPLFTAIANNRSLVYLSLYGCFICDDNWMILCQSLQAYPTLTSLDLDNTSPSIPLLVPQLFCQTNERSTGHVC